MASNDKGLEEIPEGMCYSLFFPGFLLIWSFAIVVAAGIFQERKKKNWRKNYHTMKDKHWQLFFEQQQVRSNPTTMRSPTPSILWTSTLSSFAVCDDSVPSWRGTGRKILTVFPGVYAYGFERPSAIQQRAIMPIIKGRFFHFPSFALATPG